MSALEHHPICTLPYPTQSLILLHLGEWAARGGEGTEKGKEREKSKDPRYTIHHKANTVEPLYKEHLSNEDTVCSPNHIELCTNLPLK